MTETAVVHTTKLRPSHTVVMAMMCGGMEMKPSLLSATHSKPFRFVEAFFTIGCWLAAGGISIAYFDEMEGLKGDSDTPRHAAALTLMVMNIVGASCLVLDILMSWMRPVSNPDSVTILYSMLHKLAYITAWGGYTIWVALLGGFLGLAGSQSFMGTAFTDMASADKTIWDLTIWGLIFQAFVAFTITDNNAHKVVAFLAEQGLRDPLLGPK